LNEPNCITIQITQDQDYIVLACFVLLLLLLLLLLV